MTFKKIALASFCIASSPIALLAANVKPVIEVWPAMVRLDYNPLIQLDVSSNSELLQEIHLDFSGTTNFKDIKEITVYVGGDVAKAGKKFASVKPRPGKLVLKGSVPLDSEDKIFVSVRLADKVASLSDKISLSVSHVKIGKSSIDLSNAKVTQRIGYTIAKTGDCNSKNYRIPAITQTKKGTLVAVFDIRYGHAGDLPANIDIGMSRSTDLGKTWSAVEPIMTSKGMEVTKGVGDPGILYDAQTDEIFVAGLWAPQSGHPIWSSESGTTSPQKCGQILIISSKNDGKSWSKPVNITESVKRLDDADTKNWACLFQGPGEGIQLKDGTLVFPCQVWNHKGQGGEGASRGVLVYSKDHGKTWTSSKETPHGGSESTCVELNNGTILFNSRGGAGGRRDGYETKDLGKTWKSTENLTKGAGVLRQPGGCQAASLKVGGKIYFSNPDSSSGRRNMTVKMTSNEGRTWNKGLLYDARPCAGYSSLCTVDGEHIGVIYEGSPNNQVLNFLALPYADIDKVKADKKSK